MVFNSSILYYSVCCCQMAPPVLSGLKLQAIRVDRWASEIQENESQKTFYLYEQMIKIVFHHGNKLV